MFIKKYFSSICLSFYNHFFNYVYLAPTNELWFGFPIYRYRQQDATQYGTEVTLTAKPAKNLQIGVSYSAMNSRTADGNYTPFIPAQKFMPTINYHFAVSEKQSVNVFLNADYCLAQNNVYKNEIRTPQYFLWNMGISTVFSNKNATYDVSLVGNNLANVAYYDHLSRFKYFGLNNIGRNFALLIRMKLHADIKKK